MKPYREPHGMTEDGVDVVGCILLSLVIVAVTLGAVATSIQVTPWLLFFWVPVDLVSVLLLVATVAVGLKGGRDA